MSTLFGTGILGLFGTGPAKPFASHEIPQILFWELARSFTVEEPHRVFFRNDRWQAVQLVIPDGPFAVREAAIGLSTSPSGSYFALWGYLGRLAEATVIDHHRNDPLLTISAVNAQNRGNVCVTWSGDNAPATTHLIRDSWDRPEVGLAAYLVAISRGLLAHQLCQHPVRAAA